MTSSRLTVCFAGGQSGAWRVERIYASAGRPLTAVDRIAVLEDQDLPIGQDSAWLLRGVTSYERYVHRAERAALSARSPSLGRPDASHAALIPIRKSTAWWELTQGDRRAIFEERSRHISTGLEYLPAIARRLYHSHDLGEPFDFLTWFEFAPAASERFDELVGKLRETEEWAYVEREVEIRLRRLDHAP